MPEFSLQVTEAEQGRRLDIFLNDHFKNQKLGFSRTLIQKAIQEGKITVSGVVVDRPHHKVKNGDAVTALIEERVFSELKAEKIPLEVVYEDDDLAVLNKECGLVVHPAPGNSEHTLVNALLARFKDLSRVNPARPGIVHRIDKDTSGLLVIAKNDFAHLKLTEQFSVHSIKRIYVAVVKGSMEFDEGVIDAPIARHPRKREQMAVAFADDAKYAKTRYRTLKRRPEASLVELELFTGRTHQIRVHLAFIGHPVLGDAKYGRNSEFGRLALHAKTLGFTHPRTEEYVEFTSDIPSEFFKLFPEQDKPSKAKKQSPR